MMEEALHPAVKDTMTETDPTILLTGATSGLGRALAHRLSAAPGRLILHGRDAEKLASLADELSGAAAQIDTLQADLSEISQAHRLVDDVAALTDHLDVLVNNAGIGKGADDTRQLSADGYELRLAVNHLAPFALSILLLPLLKAGAPSRIVNVASGAQQPLDLDDPHLQRGYTGSAAYAQSKLAMITTGFDLAARLPADQITVNSLHPATLMPTAMVEEGYGHTIDDLETGVEATLHLITSEELTGTTGEYFNGKEPTTAHQAAYDSQVRATLWDLSEELTGVEL